MSTLLKPLLVREQLLIKGIRIFTPLEFSRIFQTSPYSIKYFLEKQVHEGLLFRLKQGLYTLRTDPPSEEEVANKLYMPSYISFDYALAFYNLIPETTYSITSATTKPTRLFTTNNQAFAYYTIKPEAYTGYTLMRVNRSNSLKSGNLDFSEMVYNRLGTKTFLIAEPEKAVVDFLYYVSIGHRLINDRLVFKDNILNKKKIEEYAKLYDRKKLNALIKEFI